VKSTGFCREIDAACSTSSETNIWSENMKVWWKRGYIVEYIYIFSIIYGMGLP
jgi:hypothetical protein